MTDEVERPGLDVLGSLWHIERVGRPGPAREQALAAARADPANAHVHLLDATYAALVGGEPRAAQRLIAECEASAPQEEAWQRRIAACRAWGWTLDKFWYPGDVAAEIMVYDKQELPIFPVGRSEDPETRLVENAGAGLGSLLLVRRQVERLVREDPASALAHLQSEAFGEASSVLTLRLAYGDLLSRAGSHDDANAVLADVRQQYEMLAAQGDKAPVVLVCTYLVEGDWYATPGSSPEALGFDLAGAGWGVQPPSPFLGRRDLARAAAAYDRAEAQLAGVYEPRAEGALALRRATLAWLSGDHATQLTFLQAAAATFAEAGDAGAQRLTEVHRLLAEVALGRVAATRRAAGTRFDLAARGPIAALLDWGEHDGSASWTTGLGRLLQRVGDHWDEGRDYARAELAYELAVPLMATSGAEAPATLLLELAQLDRRHGFGERALTRIRAAVATLPQVTHASSESLDWQRNVDALLRFVNGQLEEAATAGIRIAALEWAIERVRELLALPGVPPAGSRQGLELATTTWTIDESREIAADHLAGFAESARATVAFADMYASFARATRAAAAGATGTAERWYDDALAKVDALAADAAPWRVFIWAARDRFEEAQAALRALLDAPEPSKDRLASAAVRAQDYETALRLFGREPDTERPLAELLDYAEAALGAGEIDLAVALTDRAVGHFEERFGRLRRDVDRLAVSDNSEVAGLYLLAARAQLARAQQLEAGADPAAASKVRARAFELSDRARALALAALLADASDDTDDERLILAWRQATTEWQSAYERLNRAYVTTAGEEDVRSRIAELASAEDQLVEVEAEIEGSKARMPSRAGRREPAVLEDVQRALPPDAALVEYELVDRDLLVWTITRRSASAVTSRHATGAIARLAKAVQRECSNGQPGPEAAELADILLAPVASVADACGRLIIVPYGPLHGLPFQVLPLHGRALGETHVLSYLPAAALLEGETVDEPVAGGGALVVGDPAFDAAFKPSLRRLPGAALEATSVAETYGVRPLIGSDAAEETIRRDLAGCNLIHLAAHGRLDPIAPSDSSIVLAGRDELTVSDFIGLRIDAELAVLSACDSGRGAASLGGDVVGLARGLIAAGARRSVVSLWPVDDAPAAATMSLFHEHVAGGMSAAGALHAAQQAVRGMSGDDISARYLELGGDPGETANTRRRGAPSADRAPTLPLDPEFVDDLADDEPVDILSGELARVWAPFVVIGV